MISVGQNFPVSEYYREQIVDAVTINRSAFWWTAAIKIRNPKSGKLFIAIYKFHKRGENWSVHQKLHVNSLDDAGRLQEAISQLSVDLA